MIRSRSGWKANRPKVVFPIEGTRSTAAVAEVASARISRR